MADSPYKEFRKDGWPYCPRCEEDELYSFLMMRDFEQLAKRQEEGNPPTVEECMAAGMRCYRCGWDSELARVKEALAGMAETVLIRASAQLN